MNDFTRLGITTAALMSEVARLLVEASKLKDEMGAVNWGDIGIADVEYRLSMLREDAEPWCVVTLEEASPGSHLGIWITERLDRTKFPNTYVECEW